MSSSTVDKAVELLEVLAGAPDAQGVTALATTVGQPKANVHRLLRSLVKGQLVEQQVDGRYRLGVGLARLGLRALASEPLVSAAQPVMQRVAVELSETIFLAAARGGQVTVLERAEGPGPLRAAPELGSAIPVHATATGRLYLAFAPEMVVLPAGRLEAFTPETPTSRKHLSELVEVARARGWDHNGSEWIAGLSVVAVPLWTGGAMVGALALAAPSSRLPDALVPSVVNSLQSAAEAVSARHPGGVR